MITYKLDRPTQYASFEVFVIGEFTAFQNLNRINDGHAAVEFTARDIVIEVLKKKRFKRIKQKRLIDQQARTLRYHSTAS